MGRSGLTRGGEHPLSTSSPSLRERYPPGDAGQTTRCRRRLQGRRILALGKSSAAGKTSSDKRVVVEIRPAIAEHTPGLRGDGEPSQIEGGGPHVSVNAVRFSPLFTVGEAMNEET